MAIDWTKAAQITQSAKQYNGTTLPATPGSASGINWEAAAKITGQTWKPTGKSSAGTASLNELVGFTRSAPSTSTTGRITATPPEGATARTAGATKKEEEKTGDLGYIAKSFGLNLVGGAVADPAKAVTAAAAEEVNRDHSTAAMANRALGGEKAVNDAAIYADLGTRLKKEWDERGEDGALKTAKDILFDVYDAGVRRLKNQITNSAVGVGAGALAKAATDIASRVSGKDEDTVKEEATEKLYSLTDPYDEAMGKLAQEGEGRSNAVQLIADAAGQVGHMLPNFAVSAIAGGAGLDRAVASELGLASMGSGAAGNAAKEAYENGASAGQAATIGLEKGIIEYGTEKMFSGFALMGDGIVSTMAKTGLGKAAATSTVAAALKDTLGRFAASKIGRLLFQGGELLGENVEEAVSDWASSNVDAVNGLGEGSTLAESFAGQMPWTRQGLVTMLTSIILSGTNYLAKNNVTKADTDAAVDNAVGRAAAQQAATQQTTPAAPQNAAESGSTGSVTDLFFPSTQQNIDNASGTQYNNSIGGEGLGREGTGGQAQTGENVSRQREYDQSATGERVYVPADSSGIRGVRALSDTQRQTLTDRGIVYFDTQDVSGNNAAFSVALEEGKASQKYGPFVDSKSPEQLEGTRAFLAENGAGGFAVRNDGDVEAVFTRKGVAPPNSAAGLVIGSVAQGGTKLDCYGIVLVNNYAKGGFVPVAQVDWNQDYAPDGWTPELGTPQVYVMMHNGDSADTVAQNFGQYKAWTQAELDALPRFTGVNGYDNALAYRDMLLRQQQEQQQNMPPNGGEGAAVRQSAQEAYQRATPVQQRLDRQMAQIAAALGIQYTPGQQKAIESIESRIRRNEARGRGRDVYSLKDLARTHLEMNSWDDIPRVLAELDKMNIPYTAKAKSTPQGYKGLHVTWNDGGIGIELQLSTPEAWKVKMQTEEIFVKWRDIEATGQIPAEMVAEYNADIQRSMDLWDQLALPDFSAFETKASSSEESGLESSSQKSPRQTGLTGVDQAPLTNSSILPSPGNLSMRPSGLTNVATTSNTPSNQGNVNIPQNSGNVNNGLSPVVDLFVPQQQEQQQNNPTDSGTPPTVGRTAPTQSAFAEQALEGTPLEGRTTHEVHSDAQVNAEADARMQNKAGETERLFGDDHQTWGDTDTEVAKRLISEAITKAKETGDWSEVARLRRVYDAEGTKAGQEMRQRRTFKNTPEDIVSAAADILYGKTKAGLDNARSMTDAEKAEVMKNVETFAKDAANIAEGNTAAVIEQIKRLNEARHTTGVFRTNTSRTVSTMLEKVARMEGGDAFLRNLLSAQIQGYANDYKAPSRVNQVKTFRVMNLLSKLSTVARNLVSNTVFDPVETLSNNISIPLDALLSNITGTRSVAFDRSWASKAKRQGSVEGFIKSYLQVAMDAEFDGETGKYEDSGARAFKMGGGANLLERMLSQWQMYENVLLKSTDEFAKGGARAEAQRGTDLLVERGLASQEGLSDTAENIAKERTLQENSWIAKSFKTLRDAGNYLGMKDSRGGSLGAGDLLVTFAQVPANVGLMNVRMNPFAGGAIAVKNLVQTLKAAHNGTLTAEQQRQAVMSGGRALTGTALATIGAVLSAKGIIRVAGSDDKDKAAIEKAERQNGMQINLSAAERVLNGGSGEWQDGDTLMSIGFLEQIAGPLMLGNVLYDAYKDDGSLSVDEIGKASLSSLAESMMELPAISQISGLVQDYQYSSADTAGGKLADAAVGFAGNTAASFLVPNALRGIAQGMDNTVRNTYSSGTTLGDAWDYIRAGIPGLREQLPSSVDSWGQERNYTDSDVLNALNANILPGAITQYNTNEVNQELARLYEAGYDKVYPDRPSSSTRVNDKQLGAEAQRQYNVDKGSTAYDLLAEMFGTSTYQNMMDEDKKKAIDAIYSYAKAVANDKAGSNKDAEKWIVNAWNANRRGGDAVGYMAMKALYGADMAGAYLNLTDAGVDGRAASQIMALIDRRGGGNQDVLYKVIRELGLNDAGAAALWGAYAKQKNWTTSWEDYVKKQEK